MYPVVGTVPTKGGETVPRVQQVATSPESIVVSCRMNCRETTTTVQSNLFVVRESNSLGLCESPHTHRRRRRRRRRAIIDVHHKKLESEVLAGTRTVFRLQASLTKARGFHRSIDNLYILRSINIVALFEHDTG